ncbi:MAG TPA: hypothetical protein VFA92_07540 [Candidatus Binatia bacterium]|nr:hypothetical protein [Candidatus Binatia bacterium]
MRPIRAAAVALMPSVAVLALAVPAWASGGAPPPSDTQVVPCSAAALISAIDKANTSGGGDLTLTRGCRYTLTSARPGTEDGLPPIRSTIALDGNGATVTRSTTPTTPEFRILEITSGELTVRSLTISNGHAPGPEPDGGGGIEVRESGRLFATTLTVTGNVGTLGAGINNFGRADVTSSAITRNEGLHGGGLSNSTRSGNLSVTSSLVSGNRAESDAGVGGGLHNQTGGFVSVLDTAITGNRGDNSAGGVFNDHDSLMNLTNTQVSQNQAGPLFSAPTVVLGGGIRNEGTMTLKTTSIEHNHAAKQGSTLARGGGIANLLSDQERSAPPKLTLERSRVAGNLADDAAGGIYNNQGEVDLTNTPVTGNRPSNCAGSPTPVSGCET